MERANGTIKSNTIFRQQYDKQKNLIHISLYYLLYRKLVCIKRTHEVNALFDVVKK